MANRLKGITLEIGGDTSKLDKSLNGVNKEISSTQNELKDVQKLLKLDPSNIELLKQKQKLLTDQVHNTTQKLDELKKAQQTMDANGVDKSSSAYMALQREIIETEHSLEDLEKAANQSNAAMESIAATAGNVSKGAGQVATATAGMSAAAAGVLGASVASAISFDDSFAKVSTLLDKGTTDFDAYKQSIIDGSNETGIAVGEYAEAVYSAISASVDQADAVQFVTDANKLAQGGFTSLTNAVDVLTTVTNAYGESAGSAAQISDILITTQNQGKTTVDELASSLGAVIPVASSAGESFAEVGAEMALMTKNGVSTSQSATYLKSMLSELSKSGSSADKALREMAGKGYAELKAEGKSTAEIMAMLDSYAKDHNKTLKDMFSSTEAGSAALILYKDSGEALTTEMKAMTSATGAADEAFETVADTTGHKLSNSLNEVKNAAVQLGEACAPVVDMVVDWIKKVTEWLSSLDTGTLQFIAVVLALIAAVSPVAGLISTIAGAISAIIPIVLALNAAIAANPVVAICIAAGVAIAAIVVLIIKYRDQIKAAWDALVNWVTSTASAMWNWMISAVQACADAIANAFKAAFQAIVDFGKSMANSLISIIESAINWCISCINSVINSVNAVANAIASLMGMRYSGMSNISNVKLKKFATGGSITNGAALVGEYGPELLTVSDGRATVTPLTATLDSSSISALQGNQGATHTNVNIQFTGSLAQLARVLQPVIETETSRRGAALVT